MFLPPVRESPSTIAIMNSELFKARPVQFGALPAAAEQFPKGPNLEKIQDLEIFKRA